MIHEVDHAQKLADAAPFGWTLCGCLGCRSPTVPQIRRSLRTGGKPGEEWLTYGLTPGETRYSPLDQINVGNVKRLGLEWSFDLKSGGGNQEATPLMWNGPFT